MQFIPVKKKVYLNHVRCPYCYKWFKNKYAVYGHWAYCDAYKEFLETHPRDDRIPFVFRSSGHVADFGPGLNPHLPVTHKRTRI